MMPIKNKKFFGLMLVTFCTLTIPVQAFNFSNIANYFSYDWLKNNRNSLLFSLGATAFISTMPHIYSFFSSRIKKGQKISAAVAEIKKIHGGEKQKKPSNVLINLQHNTTTTESLNINLRNEGFVTVYNSIDDLIIYYKDPEKSYLDIFKEIIQEINPYLANLKNDTIKECGLADIKITKAGNETNYKLNLNMKKTSTAVRLVNKQSSLETKTETQKRIEEKIKDKKALAALLHVY